MKHIYFSFILIIFSSFLSFSQTGTHLNFGGANDYVDCGSDPSLEITGNTITLEAYVKFNAFGAAHWLGNIINKASPNASGYMLRAGGNGAVNFVVANFGWHELTTADNTITLDTWFHIAGVYNGTTLKIYIDGIEVASTNIAMGNIGNSTFNANLGRDPQDTVRRLDASLDDVRIWNIARTAEQINAGKNCELLGNETGLVAYYKFNQGIAAADNTSETTVIDATGTNNGTLTNFDLTGTTSNWLAGSPMEILPSAPTVATPVTYTQGDTVSQLTATTGSNGTGLMWFTSQSGGTGDANAPIPDTSTVGSTSYWVASTNANGCESERTEMVVMVNAIPQATHLNFGGAIDYVNCGNGASLQISGDAITLEAYIKFNSFAGAEWGGNIINKSGTGDYGYMLRAGGNGVVNFNLGNGAWHEVNSPQNTISLNTWYHIAGVYDGTTQKIFVDGIEVASNNLSINFVESSFDLNLGRDPQFTDRGIDASIDEVKIWNIARTAEQINGSKNCEFQGDETGLTAYYKFNQGNDAADNTSETSLLDATSNGNNGTLTNFDLTGATSNWLAGSPVTTGSIIPSEAIVTTPVTYYQGDAASPLTATTGANGTGLMWYTTETGGSGSATAPTPSTATVGATSYWVSSVNANGCESERTEIVVTVVSIPATHLNFDGVDDHIILPNESNYDFTTDLTIEFMIKTTFFDGLDGFITKGNSSWRIHGGLNGTVMFAGNNSFNDFASTTSIDDDSWHHVAVTYNGSAAKIYVDGVLESSYATSNSIQTNSDPIAIGAMKENTYTSRFFNGSIDEVRIWNIARTEEQIFGSKDCELQGTETGLVSYYKFNQGIDATDNTAITALIDATASANDGSINNMALTGSTSNFLAGSPMVTGETLPSMPTAVTPVTYYQGDTASALTATTGAYGTGLMWYATETGGTGDVNAPTPNTATVGTTSYWVTSTNDNGCESERSEIVVNIDETLGINQNEGLDNIRIYPNPTNSLLHISNINGIDIQASIYDINGRLLLDKNCDQELNTINISTFSNGIYLLRMKTDLSEITKRIIKE